LDVFGGIGSNGNIYSDDGYLILLAFLFTLRGKKKKGKQQKQKTCTMKSGIHFDFFSKRRNINNILSVMKGNFFNKKGILIILCAMLLTTAGNLTSFSQGKDKSQRRMEKEKEQKDKEARKKYEMAVKQHEKNQSATTRSMMKETKKESSKNTPLKPSSRKKCKQQ
jgi:hypothetical protein